MVYLVRFLIFIFFLVVGGCGGDSRNAPDETRFIFDAEGRRILLLQGEKFGDGFGRSVTWVGDINGDNHPDILVGAPFAPGGQETDGEGIERGAVYLFYGGPSMDNTFDAVIFGEVDRDHFGLSLADAGDFDGDGYGDFWVGTPDQSNSGQEHNGAVYLFRGGPALIGSLSASNAVLKLFRGGEGSGFGTSLSVPGDVNGDGIADLLVGAPNEKSGDLIQSGIVYLYFGPSMEVFAAIEGPDPNGQFGFSLTGVGDLNGDNRSDFLVGNPTSPSRNPNGILTDKGCIGRGSAYLFFGREVGGYTQADRVMSGQEKGECFGYTVASGGDIDGDGVSDMAIGAPRSRMGRVYLYMGASVLTGSLGQTLFPDQVLSGFSPDEFFGASLAPFSDRSGNGLADLVVGAYGRERVGGVDLFNGGDPLSLSPVERLTGSETLGYFGLTVSAGGLQGKGVLIGTPLAEPGKVTLLVF